MLTLDSDGTGQLRHRSGSQIVLSTPAPDGDAETAAAATYALEVSGLPELPSPTPNVLIGSRSTQWHISFSPADRLHRVDSTGDELLLLAAVRRGGAERTRWWPRLLLALHRRGCVIWRAFMITGALLPCPPRIVAPRSLRPSRLLKVVAALATAMSAWAAAPAAAQDASGAFSDDDGAYYEAPFDALAERGILTGTECAKGQICPGDPIKRSTMAVWLGRALTGSEPTDTGAGRFADVDAGHWTAPHIERFAELGVTLGCATQPLRYCPDQAVTRAQMAAFLVRAFELDDAPSAGFTDTSGHHFETEIDKLAAARITLGCTANPRRYCPNRHVTRGQMATFLARALGLTPPPEPQPATADTEPAISISDTHGCKLSADGRLACWGDDTHGQASPPPGTYTNIAVSTNYSCAIRSDGQLACWGDGDRRTTQNIRATPPAGAFIDVTANPEHPCGIRADGTIACWGRSDTSYPGGGSTDRPPSGTYTDISLSPHVGCAIRTDQSIQCWGWTSDRFGIGPSPQGTFTAVDVTERRACALRTDATITCWGNSAETLHDAPAGSHIDISVADGYACALRTDRTITCWGEDTASLSIRVDGRWQSITITGLANPPTGNYQALALTDHRACALRTDYTYTCWGGDAPIDDARSGPASGSPEVTGSFKSVEAGGGHSCGLRTDGTITCWGTNEAGESDAPAGSFKSVAAGGGHSCGLRTDGTIVCWGFNEAGESDAPAGSFKSVTVGGGHSCGLRTDGTIVCWGDNRQGQADAPAGDFEVVAAGGWNSCGLRTDGTIVCWGWNYVGQTDAPAGSFKSVTTGSNHSCGLRTDDTVVCWGDDHWGQADAPAGSFKSVAAGGGHSCGLRTDGTIVCWGFNEAGESDAPAGSFKSVTAGTSHSCGLRTDDTIVCWGDNRWGQAGEVTDDELVVVNDENDANAQLVMDFLKANIIDRYGPEHPWLQEVWNYALDSSLDFKIEPIRFTAGSPSRRGEHIEWRRLLKTDVADGAPEFEFDIYNSVSSASGFVVPDATLLTADHEAKYIRELAHIYVGSVNVLDDPTSIALAQVYFNNHRSPWNYGQNDCYPIGLVVDILVHQVAPNEMTMWWQRCPTLPDRPDRKSTHIVQQAVSGILATDLLEDLTGKSDDSDLDRIWACTAYFRCERLSASTIAPHNLLYQMRKAFGGYCSGIHVEYLLRFDYELNYLQPWRNGGCSQPDPTQTSGIQTASNLASRQAKAIVESYAPRHPWLATAWEQTNHPAYAYIPVAPHWCPDCPIGGGAAALPGRAMRLPVAGYVDAEGYQKGPGNLEWDGFIPIGASLQYQEVRPPDVVHELTHDITLSAYDVPQAATIAIGMLYFNSLHLTLEPQVARTRWCSDQELFAQAAEELVFPQDPPIAFNACTELHSHSAEAVAVARDTLNGVIPNWFYRQFGTQDGGIDYVQLWESVKAAPSETIVRQLERAFGGYCFDIDSVRYAGTHNGIELPENARQPWVDGGCPG